MCDEFVLSLHTISSDVIKFYLKYIKNKYCNLLPDNTVSATMYLREMSTSQHVETLFDSNPDPYNAHKLCQERMMISVTSMWAGR